MKAKTVFISYSHDSPEHSDLVLEFSNALRGHGIEADLDRYHVRPPKGWPHWCEAQLRPENSSFVLLVCTETYLRRVQDNVSADEGRGVFWEGAIISDYIYDSKGNTRFIPILFSDGNPDFIPIPIRNHTRYQLKAFDLTDAGYQGLYRELTGQLLVKKPPIGKIVELGHALATRALPLEFRAVKTDFTLPATVASIARPIKRGRRRVNARMRTTVYAIEIVADGPLTEFDPQVWQAALRELAGQDISKIQITSIRKGSTVVRLAGDPDVIAKVLQKLKTSDLKAKTRVRSYRGVVADKSSENIFGRSEEIAQLDAAWADQKVHVVTIVGAGGTGKSHLVTHWMTRLAANGWRRAERVFDWSFYSQGLREQGTVSGDAFINAALIFFGDSSLAQSAASPWDKGAHLAQLVAQQRTLLVLDGLEPLQHPHGPLMGQLRDPGVAALLRVLARHNRGLCIVTTRASVTDLAAFRNTTTPEWELGNLTTSAGVELLKSIGVNGRKTDLERSVHEVGGHAFTLYLLGRYLVSAHRGDIKRRDTVEFDWKVNGSPTHNAFKTLNAYENWLPTIGEDGRRQLAILRLLGLFDRPASFGCLASLRRKPPISGLTDPLVGVMKPEWDRLLVKLADDGLISVKRAHSAVDAHPIIREYFGQRLREQTPKAWAAGHRRVYQYLKRFAKNKAQPTLEDLQPLYQAVAHGCQAGLQHDACDLYEKRILRRNERLSWKKLGAFGADLGAISCFFERPYVQISSRMTEAEGAFLLDEAALGLRALGRLTEATDPIRAAIKMAINQSAWTNVARGAGNLSELQLTLGDLSSALSEAQKSVDYSDRSRDLFVRSVMKTILADALHHSGKRKPAEANFRQAETMQAELQPEYPLLYSVRGFRYCDLQLSSAERAAWRVSASFKQNRPSKRSKQLSIDTQIEDCRIVSQRVARTLQWTRDNKLSLLDIALDNLTLGRSALYTWILTRSVHPSLDRHLTEAVTGLRGAGSQDHIPRGLLSRAWLSFLENKAEAAQTDLDEAWEIADRGPMRLHMADIHLYRARLFGGMRDEGGGMKYPWDKNPDGSARGPKDDLKDARKLIEQCGYWRRKEELEDAEEAAKNWT